MSSRVPTPTGHPDRLYDSAQKSGACLNSMINQTGQSVNFGTSVSRVKTPPMLEHGKDEYCETMASSEHKGDGDSTLVFLNNFMI